MTYVDGYVLPVPKKNIKKYQKMAQEAGKIWINHGALEYFECIGDDLKPNMGGATIATFPEIVKPKQNETILFSFIIFKSRKHRDQVNSKVMKEMEKSKEKYKNIEMPFDVKRMAYGGFKTIVKK